MSLLKNNYIDAMNDFTNNINFNSDSEITAYPFNSANVATNEYTTLEIMLIVIGSGATLLLTLHCIWCCTFYLVFICKEMSLNKGMENRIAKTPKAPYVIVNSNTTRWYMNNVYPMDKMIKNEVSDSPKPAIAKSPPLMKSVAKNV